MVFTEKEDAIETINNIVAENDISACEIKVCSEAVMDVNLMKATMLGMFQKILDLEENTNEGSSNEAYIWAEEHIPEKIRKDLGIEKPKSYKFVRYRFDVNLVVPSNFTEEQINEFCLELPKYKRPKKIIFAKVPRNPTGKIEKPKLREMYRTVDPFASMR